MPESLFTVLLVGGTMTAISTGFTTSFGNGLLGGQNLGEALWSGIKSGVIGGVSGAALGGMAGGIDAAIDGRRFWNGAKVNDYRLRDHNIPFVQQNTDYNCAPASAEAVTKGQLNQNDVRTALGGNPNKEGLRDIDVMQHIQNNTGRRVSIQYGDVDAIYNAMTYKGNVVLSLKGTMGNPGHMVVGNSVWQRTITKISGRTVQKLVLQVMDPDKGQYIWRSIGDNQRFFIISF